MLIRMVQRQPLNQRIKNHCHYFIFWLSYKLRNAKREYYRSQPLKFNDNPRLCREIINNVVRIKGKITLIFAIKENCTSDVTFNDTV